MSKTQNAVGRKKIVAEFFQLVGEGRMKEAQHFFTPTCEQHNPFIRGGMESLLEGMGSAVKEMGSKYPEADFNMVSIMADGDDVAAHTQLLNSRAKPQQGGLRQAHLFRFEGNKIVEYWDITQQITPDMPNAGGAF